MKGVDVYLINEKPQIPVEIMSLFIEILEKNKNFVGEKPLGNGFLIKKSANKATITLDRGGKVYSAKMIFSHNEWNVVGIPSIWDNIKDITML